MDQYLESTFIEISNFRQNILVGVIYRRPHTDLVTFISALSKAINTTESENKICTLTDFDINLLQPQKLSVQDLLATSHPKLHFCTITKPTRVHGPSATLIDHIWTNDLAKLLSSFIIYFSISDHFPNFSIFDFKTSTQNTKRQFATYSDHCQNNINNVYNSLS